jgi:hypothetical protein
MFRREETKKSKGLVTSHYQFREIVAYDHPIHQSQSHQGDFQLSSLGVDSNLEI